MEYFWKLTIETLVEWMNKTDTITNQNTDNIIRYKTQIRAWRENAKEIFYAWV